MVQHLHGDYRLCRKCDLLLERDIVRWTKILHADLETLAAFDAFCARRELVDTERQDDDDQTLVDSD